MANLPSDFWSGWVIVLSVVSFVGLGWLVFSIFFGKHDTAPAHAPIWDDDLEEGDHPAPMWWFWMILSAMVFSVLYLMLYPGLGSFAGAFNWSQASQLHEHQRNAEELLTPKRQYLMEATLEELSADPQAMASAARLFLDNCAACHGAEGVGQLAMFPNLRDGDWLWGGAPEQLEQTIRNGRTAVMVPWLPVLGEEAVTNVADYVRSMSEGVTEGHPGQAVFNQFCIACHGADGGGNPLLGAPRLNDDIWLYGGSSDVVRASVANGRNGQMPAFESRLDDLDIKLLVAWLLAAQ